MFLLAPDDPIEILVLPDSSMRAASALNRMSGERFPGLHQRLQCVAALRPHDDVDVIVHDHKGVEVISKTIEVPESIRYYRAFSR